MVPIDPFTVARLPRIVFGAGAGAAMPKEARAFGRRALIVTGGRSFRASPHWGRLLESLEREGVTIELRHFLSPGHVGEGAPRPMNALGMSHLSVRVDDLDAVLAELQRADVEILSVTRVDAPEAGIKAIFVADPDGTLIELAQRAGD